MKMVRSTSSHSRDAQDPPKAPKKSNVTDTVKDQVVPCAAPETVEVSSSSDDEDVEDFEVTVAKHHRARRRATKPKNSGRPLSELSGSKSSPEPVDAEAVACLVNAASSASTSNSNAQHSGSGHPRTTSTCWAAASGAKVTERSEPSFVSNANRVRPTKGSSCTSSKGTAAAITSLLGK